MLKNCVFAQTKAQQSCLEFLQICHIVIKIDSIVVQKLYVDYGLAIVKDRHHHFSRQDAHFEIFGR